MRTRYYTATTLDGFVATEDDSLDWLMALGDVGDSSYPAFIAQVGAIAMGASTYRWIRKHGDEVAAQAGAAWPYTQPTWVFTHRDLPGVPGADVRFASGDVSAVHAEMRAAAGAGDLWIAGGGDLAGQFLDAGLLDEVIVQIGSVTLGRGKPLLPRRALFPTLRLASVLRMGETMVELRYDVDREARDRP